MAKHIIDKDNTLKALGSKTGLQIIKRKISRKRRLQSFCNRMESKRN